MQFAAIFTDTWLLLRARKLFWLTLAITMLMGVLYASLGFTDTGVSLFFVLDLPHESLKAGTPGAEAMAFNAFYQITNWWTALFGVILGLVTCASIFPEMMSPGAVDAVLSKPIGRGRLFFYKFVCGLVFMAAQVSVLAVIVLAAMRWRLGFWHFPVLWSIPLAVLLFSYLYAVCVLFGVWTRSALAALLLTLLVWLGCATIQFSEQLTAQLSRTSTAASALGGGRGNNTAETFHRAFRTLMAVLPKTGETTVLIKRTVMRQQDAEYLTQEEIDTQVKRNLDLQTMLGQPVESEAVIRQRVEADLQAMQELERSPHYIVGTSLLFEAMVLLLGGWIFSRRDY